MQIQQNNISYREPLEFARNRNTAASRVVENTTPRAWRQLLPYIYIYNTLILLPIAILLSGRYYTATRMEDDNDAVDYWPYIVWCTFMSVPSTTSMSFVSLWALVGWENVRPIALHNIIAIGLCMVWEFVLDVFFGIYGVTLEAPLQFAILTIHIVNCRWVISHRRKENNERITSLEYVDDIDKNSVPWSTIILTLPLTFAIAGTILFRWFFFNVFLNLETNELRTAFVSIGLPTATVFLNIFARLLTYRIVVNEDNGTSWTQMAALQLLLATVGRTMASALNSAGSSLVATTVLGLIEIVSRITIKHRDSFMIYLHTCEWPEPEYWATPRKQRVLADTIIVEMIAELAAISFANMLVLIVNVWHFEVDPGEAFSAFIFNWSMQMMVEAVSDAISVMVEERWAGLRLVVAWHAGWKRMCIYIAYLIGSAGVWFAHHLMTSLLIPSLDQRNT
jgi:hypothetical protein